MNSILIADDDKEMRELLRFKLQSGYEVTTVNDGEECWNYLKANPDNLPDLIILDIMMPGLSGYRVLDRMQDSERSIRYRLLCSHPVGRRMILFALLNPVPLIT